jgi:hypothetical protein
MKQAQVWYKELKFELFCTANTKSKDISYLLDWSQKWFGRPDQSSSPQVPLQLRTYVYGAKVQIKEIRGKPKLLAEEKEEPNDWVWYSP